MFTRNIAVFVAVVVLVTGSPAMAQSSDLLASAERAALTMQAEQELEQDQSVIRRRRSGGLGAAGVVMAGVGVFLALQPPVCGLSGSSTGKREYFDAVGTFEYEHTLLNGQCVVRVENTLRFHPSFGGRTRRYAIYSVDNEGGYDDELTPDDGVLREATASTTRNKVGWVTAAAGGALMWFGLRSVDVPVRFDVAPAGGFRVSRSLGW